MQIITEINHDWLWVVGILIILVSVCFFVMFVEKCMDWAGVVGGVIFFMGACVFVAGLVQLGRGHSFRIKMEDSYTVSELVQQCNSIKYEPEYDTWLVRFKEDKQK